jgi:hypothetical protein
VELAYGFQAPLVAFRRTLALDDDERDTVHEHDDVGNDVLLRADNLVLARDEKLVVLGCLEVEEVDRMAFLAAATVLFRGCPAGC